VNQLQRYNIVDMIFTRRGLSVHPVLRLDSIKAGVVLRFFTNRMSHHCCFFLMLFFLCGLIKIIESGVRFSSNHLSTPDQGARKIAHGGSGISGRGDSYGPWCTFLSMSQVHKISLLTV